MKKTIIIIISLSLLLVQSFTSMASADISPQQSQAFQQGEDFFDTTIPTSCSGSGASGGSTSPVTGAGAWNSTVAPPYYLESFVINVLEDVAQIENVPQTDTVTQEHVVALVAWGYAEGGNIANTDVYNIWNTGIDNPALIAGNAAGNGVQSFVSFNAGVTAAAVTMTGSLQSRIGQTLSQPGTTAEQFMQALTYYQNYPGNSPWAQADADDQQSYINTLMEVLSQTRANYSEEASVEIGPGQEDTNHVPASQLQYSGGTSNPTTSTTVSSSDCADTSSSSTCQSSSSSSTNNDTSSAAGQSTTAKGNAEIACDVLQYDPLSYSQSWHMDGSDFHAKCPTIGPQCATDCSGLVSIALYDVFGNDGLWTTYTMVSDKSNFEEISASQLMPGDFIEPAAEQGDHVIIVESISGNTAQTFAANTDVDVSQANEVSAQPYTLSSGDIYLRYIGEGSTYTQ